MIIRAAFLFRAKYRDCVPAFISHAFAQVSYRFNGKESQEFACLPYLDYGARYYYPLSSRWTTIDPMAEKYYSFSPYADCVKHDNKLRFLNHNKVVNMLDNG